MTLGDFLKQLIAELQSQEIPMPYENERPWHELFFRLKTSDDAGKPDFFPSLRFDWNGPYPKSRDLSDILHALHWTACVSAQNPKYDTITLSPEIVQEWVKLKYSLGPDEQEFVGRSVKEARSSFPSTPNILVACAESGV